MACLTNRPVGKQEIFANEYLVHGNATRAYLAVNPKAKESTARVQGCRLLAKPNIAAYIEARRQSLAERYLVDQERILKEYSRIAFFNPRCLFDENGCLKRLDSLTEDEAAAIAAIDVHVDDRLTATVRIRFADKRAALDALARHLGMFQDRLEINTGNELATIIAKGRERITTHRDQAFRCFK